jgi:hypothetical protein
MVATVCYDAEGWDNIAGSLWTTKGWVGGSAPVMVTGLLGRGQAARINNSNFGKKTLVGGAHSTLCGAFRWRTASGFWNSGDFYILYAGSTLVARLRTDGSNRITVLNSGGTVIATGTTALSAGVAYMIELKIVKGATGTCEVHLNGNATTPEIASTVGNFGTADMDGSGGPSATNSAITNWDYDDMAWFDDFPGDIEVETPFPSGDGANTGLTPLGGGSHYNKVNEHTGTFPDNDTTYNSANSAVKDTYTFPALSASAGTVYAVVVNAYARKDDSGARSLDQVIRQAGADHALGAPASQPVTYAMTRWVNNVDGVGGAWTISNVNADEFGVLVG